VEPTRHVDLPPELSPRRPRRRRWPVTGYPDLLAWPRRAALDRRVRRFRGPALLASLALALVLVLAVAIGVGYLGYLVLTGSGGPSGSTAGHQAPVTLPIPAARHAHRVRHPHRVVVGRQARVSSIRVFDPAGGEAARYPGLRLAADGRLVPAFTSETYATARFGNLKPGIGLLVDLGRQRSLHSVVIEATPGAALQLRTADAPAGSAAGYRLLASVPRTSGRTVVGVSGVARFVLIWFTRLPATSAGYRLTVIAVLVR
jgi:hypothetical protein